jgi:hypothetical protein
VSPPACLAMLRSRSGLILRSRVATSGQLLLLVPGGCHHRRGGRGPLVSIGWECAINWRGKPSAQRTGIVLGGAHVLVGGGCLRERVKCTLALVGDESGDVDKTGDIRRIVRFGGQDTE